MNAEIEKLRAEKLSLERELADLRFSKKLLRVELTSRRYDPACNGIRVSELQKLIDERYSDLDLKVFAGDLGVDAGYSDPRGAIYLNTRIPEFRTTVPTGGPLSAREIAFVVLLHEVYHFKSKQMAASVPRDARVIHPDDYRERLPEHVHELWTKILQKQEIEADAWALAELSILEGEGLI